MSNNDTIAEKRIVHKHKTVRTCALCGTTDERVSRVSSLDLDIPPHTACPSCEFNPIVDDRAEYLEALRA